MLTCCRYIGRLLIEPSLSHLLSELYHASALLAKASGSGFELRRDFAGDFRPPFFHRFETRQSLAVRLGLAEQLVLGFVEVDVETARLRDVPGCIAKHLDAIALRVMEINRPGVAVADRTEALAAR